MSIPGVKVAAPQQRTKTVEELSPEELSLLSVRCLVASAKSLGQLVAVAEIQMKAQARQIELLEEIADLLTDDDDDDEEGEEGDAGPRREADPPEYARNQKADLRATGLAPRFTERAIPEPEEPDENAEFRAMCVPNPDYRAPEVVELTSEQPYDERPK